ncbi:MAG: arginase family protein [Thermoanaerobaculia bacterium]
MRTRKLSLIGVPSSAGARRTGQEGGPAAYRAAGLLEKLRAKGRDVLDEGDSPSVSYRSDPDHPRQQNASLVAEVARQTADRVERAAASGRFPVVLGGDCTVGLGVVAGLCRRHPRLGLLYFDGDVDLNTPDTTPSGIFDGMVVAHLLGHGVPELAGLGPRTPLLSEEDIVLFGYDEESGSFDPPELEVLEHSRIAKYPLARVRPDPAAAARDAQAYLENGRAAFLLHFDVDVTSLSAADVHHPRGLDLGPALAALKVFLASPACAAIVVTEFNAEKDKDGSDAARVVDGLVECF